MRQRQALRGACQAQRRTARARAKRYAPCSCSARPASAVHRTRESGPHAERMAARQTASQRNTAALRPYLGQCAEVITYDVAGELAGRRGCRVHHVRLSSQRCKGRWHSAAAAGALPLPGLPAAERDLIGSAGGGARCSVVPDRSAGARDVASVGERVGRWAGEMNSLAGHAPECCARRAPASRGGCAHRAPAACTPRTWQAQVRARSARAPCAGGSPLPRAGAPHDRTKENSQSAPLRDVAGGTFTARTS